jgi:disulfide oxidoreductase YuzD
VSEEVKKIALPMAQTGPRPVSTATMKTKFSPSLLLAAALAAGSMLTAAEPKSDAVSVAFHEPAKFTDARSHFGGGTDQHYLDMLAAHLKRIAPKHLAPGMKLEVTFTDIDLAGDFIPGDVRSQDVRIIKDIYIPRQKLMFKIIDADGQVVAEGERRLSDLNFMNNARIIGRNEPLFHDKALLSDWVAREFKS